MHRKQIRHEAHKTSEARLECPKCSGLLDDSQRYEMMLGGDWIPTREFRGRRGFQANAMLWSHPVDPLKYPGGFLQMVAESELAADRSDNPERSRRVLVNTVGAEPDESPHEKKADRSSGTGSTGRPGALITGSSRVRPRNRSCGTETTRCCSTPRGRRRASGC